MSKLHSNHFDIQDGCFCSRCCEIEVWNLFEKKGKMENCGGYIQ